MIDTSKQILQDREAFCSAFFGEECCNTNDEVSSLEEIDEAISDCKAMLDYSIDLNDKNEIAFWRKLLQKNKMQRRLLVS